MPPATNTPTKHSAAPERSLLQRMDALQRANEIRTRRAQLKKDLKAGRVSIHTLLKEPARVRGDREGLRHAPGGSEVRAGEGEQGPAAVPDLAEQDHRRPLRAPAHRARRPAPPVGLVPLAGVARVFVITGPSGVGKGTLIRTLRERMPELELSVSATTRAPRPGEQDGVDYHFLSDADFQRRVDAGEFVEHAVYSGPPLRHAALRARAPHRRRAPGRARDRAPGRAPGARGAARGRAGLHRAAVARRAAHAPDRPRHRRRRRGRRAPARGRRRARRPGRVRPRRGQRSPRGRRRRSSSAIVAAALRDAVKSA